MAVFFYVVLCICLCLQSVISQFGESCQTVDLTLGKCITIHECEPYLKLLQVNRTRATQILRKAHCGFEGNNPKVCCPALESTTTTTPPLPVLTKSRSEDFVPSLPDPPVCGFSNATGGRIVGGEPAKLNDFPWMALLGFRNFKITIWACGGSLISSRHVLTAAHCIHNFEDSLYVVRFGELDLAREDDGAHPVDVLIKDMIKHEEYTPNIVANDIGILVLQKKVQFTDSIHPICIPKGEMRLNIFENYNPLVAGWGRTKYDGIQATHLQVIQLPVVTNNVCAEAFIQYKNVEFDDRVICAGFKNGGKDACKGDSGGPLMQPMWLTNLNKAYFYQIGVVSFGKGCAEANFPGVYSRVTHFIPWIEEKVLGYTT